MYYVIPVVDKQQAGELAGFIESNVRRHLESWSNEFNVVTLELRWIAGRLILKTDSEKLVAMWKKRESLYVACLLEEAGNYAVTNDTLLNAA